MSNERMRAAMNEFREATAIVASIQSRQSDRAREQTDVSAHCERLRARTEQNLAEIRDQLRRLSG